MTSHFSMRLFFFCLLFILPACTGAGGITPIPSDMPTEPVPTLESTLVSATLPAIPTRKPIPFYPGEHMPHLTQFNIGKINYPLDDPRMAGFVDNLDRINAIADTTPGFVWRLKTEDGNAASIETYEDPRVIVNLSVWEPVDALKAYVYKSDHSHFLRRREEWFERIMPYMVMWWVSDGHIPTLEEAKARLVHLEQHGETGHAFTFRKVFEPEFSV